MTERPILFSGPMVKAILDGKKTMTRRAVKKQPIDMLPMNVPNQWCALDKRDPINGNKGSIRVCRYGVLGGRLWVRETHRITDDPRCPVIYRADADVTLPQEVWRPSIHMPRWASRITLEITDVRVERVQEIGIEDCQKEGISDSALGGKVQEGYVPQTAFADLWDSINGKTHPWESNPWVWVISFKRID